MPKTRYGAVVPRAVFDGLMTARDAGVSSMADHPQVIEAALKHGHKEAAEWIEANLGLFMEGVFNGFRPDDDEDARSSIAPGRIMRYSGSTHPGITGSKVKILRRLDNGWWEFAPFVNYTRGEERPSWITSDAKEDELADWDWQAEREEQEQEE